MFKYGENQRLETIPILPGKACMHWKIKSYTIL
jgi:hypothetical protein